MSNYKDLTNNKYGRWTVLGLHEKRKIGKNSYFYWKCKCDCGTEKIIIGENLKSGNSTSCGCKNKERKYKNNVVHGMKGTRIYAIWCSMKSRCSNQNLDSYMNYGGRGIKVCEEWEKDFRAFYHWSINNGYNEKLSIDRIDVNGNYEPSNCRWVNEKVQSNNRRNNHIVTYKNKSKTIAEWEEELGFKKDILTTRLSNGWSIEKAIETPYKKRKFNNEYGHSREIKKQIVLIDGKEKTVEDWCLIKNLKINTVLKRITRGMSPYEAITKPLANIGRWNKNAKDK